MPTYSYNLQNSKFILFSILQNKFTLLQSFRMICFELEHLHFKLMHILGYFLSSVNLKFKNVCIFNTRHFESLFGFLHQVKQNNPVSWAHLIPRPVMTRARPAIERSYVWKINCTVKDKGKFPRTDPFISSLTQLCQNYLEKQDGRRFRGTYCIHILDAYWHNIDTFRRENLKYYL
jgi:hypothetical protein